MPRDTPSQHAMSLQRGPRAAHALRVLRRI